MKKNAFTLIELLGVIVLVGIVTGLAVVSINYLIQNSKQNVYIKYENSLKEASENYLITNSNLLPKINETTQIPINDLVNAKMLDMLKDPNGGNCQDSYVEIERTENIQNNYNLKYQVCLICKTRENIETYKSTSCN